LYCFWNTADWQVRSRVPLDLGAATGPGRRSAVTANWWPFLRMGRIIQAASAELEKSWLCFTPPQLTLIGPIAFSGEWPVCGGHWNPRNRVLSLDLSALHRDWPPFTSMVRDRRGQSYKKTAAELSFRCSASYPRREDLNFSPFSRVTSVRSGVQYTCGN